MEEQKKSVVIDGVEYVPKVAEEAAEFPAEGQGYYYISSIDDKCSTTFSSGSNTDQRRKNTGNCFRTKQEADFEILRRECMATRFVPERGEATFFFANKVLIQDNAFNGYAMEVILGLAAPTVKEAQARWDKYGEAWMDVLKAKK